MTFIPASRKSIRFSFQGLLAGSLIAVSSMSMADSETTWFGEVADGEWLAGVKLGAIHPQISGYQTAPTAALVLGYQFSRPIGDNGSSSIELELGGSGNADITSAAVSGTVGDFDVSFAGLFFNYRSPGTVYFKGKAGMLGTRINSRTVSGLETTSTDTSFAIGLGAGVRLGGDEGRTSIEAEWVATTGDHDINYYNLGANIEF